MKSIFVNKHRSRAYTCILRLQTMRNIYEHCRNDDYPGTKVTQGSIMLCAVRMKNYSSCTSGEQPLRCAGRYVTLCGTSLCSFVALYWRPPRGVTALPLRRGRAKHYQPIFYIWIVYRRIKLFLIIFIWK